MVHGVIIVVPYRLCTVTVGFISEREVRYMLSPVRLSVVCLSVTFVRPTQAVQIFANSGIFREKCVKVHVRYLIY